MILKLLNAMGPRWAMQRVGFAIEHRTGALKRRMPQRRWQELALAEYLRPEIPGEAEAYLAWRKQNAAAFFFSHARLTKPFDAQSAIAAGERVLSGELPFFGHSEQTGFPPEWHRDPLTGTEWPRDRHWSEIDDFSLGDIKLVWEPSRFAFVFALVRAYATAGDERYAAAFWRAVEDWLDSNPPNSGVNWKCGQEATFRVMAWCFGLYAFEASPESRADRVAKMTLAIALHGERIAGHIDYALSQRNNHGLSEATGLFTIGTLFPELRRSAEWRALGRRLIGRQVPEQFYADGSYIQHSFNYQRVALHVLLWAMRLAEISGEPFSKDCYEAVGRSALVLARFCDSQSGMLPNYGHNDGAHILPLVDAEFSDFRPTIEAAHRLAFGGAALSKVEASDEFSLWLLGSEAHERRVDPEQSDLRRRTGYLFIAGAQSSAMLRAAEYTDRPAHADQLHLDLWYGGNNIACDAGTYAYNGPGPWKNALASARFHNTVTICGRDQMTRASRFLWVDWAQARATRYSATSNRVGALTAIAATHDGYSLIGARHRRVVLCFAEQELWLIVDEVYAPSKMTSRLHWLCAQKEVSCVSHGMATEKQAASLQLTVAASRPLSSAHISGGKLIAGSGLDIDKSEQELYGWISRDYMVRTPANSFILEDRGNVTYASVFSAVPAQVSVAKGVVRLDVNGGAITLDQQQLVLCISSADTVETLRMVEDE